MDKEFLLAKDFVPASDEIEQPKENDLFVCPLCVTPLNGWEYFGTVNNSKSHTLVFPAVSVLTKDENGNWKWVPYDVPVEIAE
jgi:ketosteroid isomerase-like protein